MCALVAARLQIAVAVTAWQDAGRIRLGQAAAKPSPHELIPLDENPTERKLEAPWRLPFFV